VLKCLIFCSVSCGLCRSLKLSKIWQLYEIYDAAHSIIFDLIDSGSHDKLPSASVSRRSSRRKRGKMAVRQRRWGERGGEGVEDLFVQRCSNFSLSHLIVSLKKKGVKYRRPKKYPLDKPYHLPLPMLNQHLFHTLYSDGANFGV